MPKFGSPILEVTDLSVSYGGIRAVIDLSLTVCRGQVVALLGANGAGKSSTVRAICGATPARAARLEYEGADVRRYSAHARARAGLVLVPEGRQVLAPLSVEDNLLLGGHIRGGRRAVSKRLAEMYDLFPILYKRRDTAAGLMSGGEQQMLALARALMSSPKIILLDEPTLGLAPVVIDVVMETVRRAADSGVSVLIVEQNVAAALPICDRVHVLEQGRLVYSGDPDEASRNGAVISAFLGIDESSLLTCTFTKIATATCRAARQHADEDETVMEGSGVFSGRCNRWSGRDRPWHASEYLARQDSAHILKGCMTIRASPRPDEACPCGLVSAHGCHQPGTPARVQGSSQL